MLRSYYERMDDQWQIARFQSFILYCTATELKDRVDIYDFLPLNGDPDLRERRKLTGKQALIDRLAKSGHLVINKQEAPPPSVIGDNKSKNGQ